MYAATKESRSYCIADSEVKEYSFVFVTNSLKINKKLERDKYVLKTSVERSTTVLEVKS